MGGDGGVGLGEGLDSLGTITGKSALISVLFTWEGLPCVVVTEEYR